MSKMMLRSLVVIYISTLVSGYDDINLYVKNIRSHIDAVKITPNFGNRLVSFNLPFFSTSLEAECIPKGTENAKVIAVKAEKHRALLALELTNVTSRGALISTAYPTGDWPVSVRSSAVVSYPKLFITIIMEGENRSVHTVVPEIPKLEAGPGLLKAELKNPAVRAPLIKISNNPLVFGAEVGTVYGEVVADLILTRLKYGDEA